jgi:hypothetical protein
MIVQLIKPAGRFRVFKRSQYLLVQPIHIAGEIIPAGFVSDGASLPPFVRGLFDPMGIWAEAAFLHDYLLTERTRAEAAKGFKNAMRELGVPPIVRDLFFGFVRLYDGYKFITT